MKKFLTIAAAALVALSMTSCGGSRAMKSDIDTVSYALGTDFGMSLKRLIGQVEGEMNMDLFYAGVEDALNDEVVLDQQEAFAFLRNYMNVTNPQKALAASEAYLAKIAENEGVQKTESGLLYEIINEGNAEKKAALDTDKVKVHYEGKLRNGEVFDSSYERGEPAEFALNQVIKGWTEGMKLVGEGGEIKLWIPANMAYGARGTRDGSIGPNQAIMFTVEVLEVIPTEAQEEK
ncbi:MAG: FKBP-type peptidyl-prolyl cis-trans isomerase [Tidjanibacter sp.]|nr:FKBP-type peptidyl-prolyl cis-trans isomerase [Tidjanibacter sp.]